MRTITKAELDIRLADLSGIPEANRRRFFNPGELDVLLALVRSVSPVTMLEFGVQNGRTARVMLDNVPSLRKYIGIDVPPTFAPGKAFQTNECPERPGELAFADPRFRLMMSGRGSHDLTALDFGVAVDVAFIDGDHSRKGVLNDHALALSLVRQGGIIIHHDYHDEGTVDVKPVLDELSAAGTDLVHVEGTWLVYLKVEQAV